jgi:hypothetical protein
MKPGAFRLYGPTAFHVYSPLTANERQRAIITHAAAAAAAAAADLKPARAAGAGAGEFVVSRREPRGSALRGGGHDVAVQVDFESKL